MLMVAAILVIALLVATILISIPPKTDYKGVLKAGDVTKDSSIIYSLKTENEFKSDISRFLENMLASFFNTMEGFEGNAPTINNSYAVSNPIISIFSKAAIPSDKLLNFGKYLKNMDSDSAVLDIWMFFIRLEENPDGTFSGRFATATELALAFTTELDFGYALSDIIQNTALTAEEAGRILYELIFIFSDAEQKDILNIIGRATFVNLFVSATTIYEAYVQFSLIGGSLTDARLIGELAYQMGAELDNLINEVGVATILTAIWLNSETASDNTALKEFLKKAGVDTSTLADIDEVNAALRAGINLAEFFVYFARTTLMEVGNATFEYLAIYYAGERENVEHYLYMHRLTLARAITKGMDKAIQEGNLIKTKEKLIESLANFKLCSEDVAGDIPDVALRRSELQEYFGEFIDTVYKLSNDFVNVESVEDIALLDESELQNLKACSDFLSEFNYNELTTGTDDLMSTIMINITFNVFSEIVNEALKDIR